MARSDVPTVLVANRGEVAVRIARAVADLGWRSAVAHSRDDAGRAHVRAADHAVALPGQGPAAYLDVAAVVEAAGRAGASFVHPGWGFLSESADLARACEQAGLTFVGPSPRVLETFGDKAAARRLAVAHGVPVVPGTDGEIDADRAVRYVVETGRPVLLKAVAGGGGRGMRVVQPDDDVAAAHAAASAEARAASGDGRLYGEVVVEGARHVEVQVVGDGSLVAHLWERDCSVQRRHQKLVELAPAPGLPQAVRTELVRAALTVASAVGYRGVGTVEFLVLPDGALLFLEVNPRLQVEHPVTEQISGVDLVVAQLRLAAGASLQDVGLAGHTDPALPPPAAAAVELRVNAETVSSDGTVRATSGVLTRFEPPTGPGRRTDTALRAGEPVQPTYDTLLAKLVLSAADVGTALRRARRAVDELHLEGVATNLPLLAAVLDHAELGDGSMTTTWLEQHLRELVDDVPADRVDGAVRAPTAGLVVQVDVRPGDTVAGGQQLAVVEAMKMQFPVTAPGAGTVTAVPARAGSGVAEGDPLVVLHRADGATGDDAADAAVDLDAVRDDLAEVQRRWRLTRDEARPDAVERRRAAGGRTARQNVDALLDDGSFTEYGAFAVAAQRARRSEEELLERSPADGLVTGVGTVGAERFGERATCAVAAYDYTVLAGTQGYHNHAKLDRLLELAGRWRWPVVLFAEGGGGRPGDTDAPWASALAVPTFARFAALSGRVPLVGVVHGNCFAGNAALLGCCDVVIATRSSSIGMGGPAMIEGGGLGVVRPEDVGPVSVQAPNGVVDVVVADETEAVEAARRYLGCFQGDLTGWECADQRELRTLVPQERRRVHDVRRVLRTLADTGSVLELRRDFAPGMVTALARVEGVAFGVLANDPAVVGGAVTAAGADKAARLLNLCEAHRLPVLSLVDTPGFMVGPDSEREAAVRRMARMFLRAAALTVPLFAVALRRGYGLGAMAMTGGEFGSPTLNVSWPSGEFGPMGLEGAVRLGMRRELEAIEDPDERERTFRSVVDMAYARGRAVNVASHLEIDAVIDPADTRAWLMRALRAAPVSPERRDGVFVDAW
ncbi:MAG TPA: carboxyl transferase domain-containing protein [Mycobacteriales bacterium]|nr:carboxyl transferase domain-containing protein [Mycobacteriales bacterium]